MLRSVSPVILRLSSPPPPPSKRPSFAIRSRIGVEDIALVAHNKVLVAATVASVLGQLSKPFTSAYAGDGFDLRALAQSGGMPSAHSAAVVAAATTIGLERGFSDPIFGLSVIFAGLVMYDAQGVRREVGLHAKVLNNNSKIHRDANLHREGEEEDEEYLVDSISGMPTSSAEIPFPLSLSGKASSGPRMEPFSLVHLGGKASTRRVGMSNLVINGEETSTLAPRSIFGPLNESVGHTTSQVLVGALLGFVTSLIAASIV